MKIRRHSEETKKIMSEAAKKRGISHETRLKINAARTGLKRPPITDEARQNMRKAAKLREEKKRLQRREA